MSNKYSGFHVAFKENVHEELMEKIQSAVECLHGVLKVEPIEGDFNEWIATERVRHQLSDGILDLIYGRK